MELPTEVLVHNELLNIKGTAARLLTIGREGYYEVNLDFGGRVHRVLLPVQGTVVIAAEAEPSFEVAEVER